MDIYSRTSTPDLIARIREEENPVTRNVLKDCAVNRLQEVYGEYLKLIDAFESGDYDMAKALRESLR